MSSIDDLESVFDDWDDFMYEAQVELDSGFESYDLITEKTREVRSYKANLQDNNFSFSVEQGTLNDVEGYVFSVDPSGDDAEYIEQVLGRLPEEFEKLDNEDLGTGEYFTQRTH